MARCQNSRMTREKSGEVDGSEGAVDRGDIPGFSLVNLPFRHSKNWFVTPRKNTSLPRLAGQSPVQSGWSPLSRVFSLSLCHSAILTLKKCVRATHTDRILNDKMTKWKNEQVRSGQVRSGQVRSGQVRSGQVRSGQVRSHSPVKFEELGKLIIRIHAMHAHTIFVEMPVGQLVISHTPTFPEHCERKRGDG
jgi:hypothetical protein